MDATAIIYDLKEIKGKDKTYLIRKIFGYKDKSNHGKYSYERSGIITSHIKEKWGQSVIIVKRRSSSIITKILKQNNISYKTRNIKIMD